ncbi:MAG: 16S rRNA (uracil(1498)-N(3))-methyltransferase [Bacteroidales bacterium]|jgi:16S rRNA (uracil1498-N3)-methyltransferase|nr:16S rRNA (uracil(1498)-N(3))-methyltransferase [Bacteroidales bacterium]
MHLFYSTSVTNNQITLHDEEKNHCTKVLRKTIGDVVHIIDGRGNLYESRIEAINKHDCLCSVLSSTPQFGTHNYKLTMCVAPTKNSDRFEFFVEKAVEFGIDEIIPIRTDNSERKILKLDRIEKIILSAMKQSYKADKPVLHELTDFADVLNRPFAGTACIAHCYEGTKQKLSHILPHNSTVCIAIGPEGDFSEQEVSQALAKQWQAITLGESRLRTETAAIAAVHSVYSFFC